MSRQPARVSRLTLREAIKPLPAEVGAEMLALVGALPVRVGATGGKSDTEQAPIAARDPL